MAGITKPHIEFPDLANAEDSFANVSSDWQKQTYMFTELCKLVSRQPPKTAIEVHSETSPTIQQAVCHWQECYRWLQFEERYDKDTNEFAPPNTPSLPYKEIQQFKDLVKSNLKILDLDGTILETIFSQIPTNCFRSLEDKESFIDILLAPRIHPEVHNTKKSRKKKRRNIKQVPVNKHLSKCLDVESQSCCILTGCASQLVKPILYLIRPRQLIHPRGLVEVGVPLQFIIILMTPNTRTAESTAEMGRIFGAFLTDINFYNSCDAASTAKEVLQACEEYLDMVVMQHLPSLEKHKKIHPTSSYEAEILLRDYDDEFDVDYSLAGETTLISAYDNETEKTCSSVMRSTLSFLCPPFAELFHSVKCLIKRYPSDFRDAFEKENISVMLSSIPFVYFVVFGPAITFSVLMKTTVNIRYSVPNSILATGFATILNGFFTTQPIAIIGPSGLTYIMEFLVASDAKKFEINYFNYRFKVIGYMILFGFIFIGLNLSNLVTFARKSLEQLFCAFISGFLIIMALLSIFRAIPGSIPAGNTTEDVDKIRLAAAGAANAFLAILMTCFCLVLSKFKASTLVRRKVRFWVGALNVPLGIIFIVSMERIFFSAYNVPKLDIPPVQNINFSTWFNFPDLDKITDVGISNTFIIHSHAVLFGFLMALLCMIEVSINTIVPIRGMAIKPCPPGINNVICLILLPLLSMFLGLPIISGVPVRTIAHMMSLVKVESNPPPGVEAKRVCLVEQRFSILIVGFLVTLSVFLGNILRLIPVASLFGLFIFLGLLGLRGLQYKRVLTAVLSRKKYWSQWQLLEGLPRKQVVFFVLLWSLELFILYILFTLGAFPETALAGITIPFMMLFPSLVRDIILPRWKWISPYLEKMDPLCVPRQT